ncbi:MAG TPA: metallophosphoesterase [Mycobacteriales bacterium]|nr:metallophosphoesterase [Mycobacteriales bacterium]
MRGRLVPLAGLAVAAGAATALLVLTAPASKAPAPASGPAPASALVGTARAGVAAAGPARVAGQLRSFAEVAGPAARAPRAARVPARTGVVTLEVVTVPPVPAARFALDGRPVATDRRGVVRLQVSRAPVRHRLTLLNPSITTGGETATFVRWWGQRDRDASYRSTVPLQPLHRDLRVQVAFSTSYEVRYTFTNQASRPIDPKRVKVTSVTFRSSTGEIHTVRGSGAVRLAGARPKLEQSKIVARDTDYSLDSVVVDGSNVVDAGRQRFRPSRTRAVSLVLQLRSVRVQAHDFLFGYATGAGLRLTYPDGHSERFPFGPDREVSLENLARGTYEMSVEGAGYSFARPVALSRSQFVDLRVVSYPDIAVVAVLLLLTLGGLVAIGRRPRRVPRPPSAGAATAVVALLAAAAVLLPSGSARAEPAAPAGLSASLVAAGETVQDRPLPLLAYYYIWFDRRSWDRAKIDYPLLGRYSSDDATVMRQHIRTAKAAGITGFIVSWKATPTNDRRLKLLTEVARSERFTLALIYQGLDFSRNPLPVRRIAADLRAFAAKYGGDSVFRIYDRPLVIWSGTWKYSRQSIGQVTAEVSDRLRVLASEKDMAGYGRVADLVDGNAYYWSSVNPDRHPGYARKLAAMASAVHAHRGLWIAPFAPGFDARLVGGTSVVDRRDGRTLQREYATAMGSSPDAMALISWNEFSENTHVEPSRHYGTRYVDVLRDLTAAPAPALGALGADSSDPSPAGAGPTGFLLVCVVFGFLLLTGAGLLLRRRAAAAEPVRPASRRPGGPARRRAHRRRSRWPRMLRMTLGLVVVAALLVGVVRIAGSTPAGSPPPPLAAALPAPPARYLGALASGADHAEVAAAGDIACPADRAGLTDEELDRPDSCHTGATADLLRRLGPDAVLTLGDNQYPNGSLSRFLAGYDKTWGRFKSITHPIPGNHEYGSPGARGYFSYFGRAAGDPDEGWYSFDLAGWHLVALNSECDHVGGCGAGSPQQRWLEADLATHPAACTLAYWHRPRYSSGSHGSDAHYDAFWTTLHRAGADVVLSGHDHAYERFAPLRPGGAVDHARGLRGFVIGTGGDSHTKFHAIVPGSEARVTGVYGVLLLTLRPDGYDWRFVSEPTGRVLDSGSGRCH